MKLLLTLLICFLVSDTPCFGQNTNSFQDSSFSYESALLPNQLKLLTPPYHFSVNKSRRFDFGITTNYCCIVLKLQSPTTTEYVLTVNSTSLDTVLIYKLLPENTIQSLYVGGSLVNYDVRRASVWHNTQVKVKQTPSYYLIVVKAIAQNTNLDYQIVSPVEFQLLYRTLDRLVFFYAGFIFLISVISLTGGLVFKQTALLVYTGYVLTLAGWILAHYGYLFSELYPSFPHLNKVVKQVTSLVSMFCLLNLITLSFQSEIKRRWLQFFFFLKTFTISLILFYLLHLAGVFGTYIPAFVNILWNVSLLISVCFIVITLTTLMRASRTARLFCIAIGLVLLMAVYQSISNVGWLYNYFLNEHGMTLASLMEVVLLAFGIFYNLWNEKQNKEMELKLVESERAKTLQMLIGVQDEERRRIAGDLHDSIGPMLAAIKINFLRLAKSRASDSVAENLVMKTENIIDESIAEIRDISHRLMPKSLSSKGLITLLSDYFAGLETMHAIRIDFIHDINMVLDKEVQLNLYRMISELCLNAAKHSGAEILYVSLETLSDKTIVKIKDDGIGFAKGVKNNSSLGLKNVQSRVEYLAGEMKLESGPDKGTVIEISIPHKL